MPDLEYVPKSTAQTWLLEMCEQLVEKFVFHVTDVQAIVEQTQELELGNRGAFTCREDGCTQEFVYHSGRVRLTIYLFCLLISVYEFRNQVSRM